MTTNNRALKVFLCHAHEDSGYVRKLNARLDNDGVDAWLDKEKLLPGQNWQLKISNAVREADVVVVCLSKKFNQAGFRQREVRLALDTAMEKPEGEIFIIPARIDACEVPDDLHNWQWVDLFESDGYEKLILALRARALEIGVRQPEKIGWFPVISSLHKKGGLLSEEKSTELNPLFPSIGEKNKSNPMVKSEKMKSPRIIKKRRSNPAIIVGLMGLLGSVVAGLLGSPLLERWFVTATPYITQTIWSTATQDPESSPVSETPSGKVIPLPALVRPTVETSVFIGQDGMPLILVPAGEFLMGSTGNAADERPIHTVYLDAFLMDHTEVTNTMYAECVKSGICDEPRSNTSITQNAQINSFYYGNPDFNNYPVIHVSWSDAGAYCEWAGRRLPTEAEWEKAASWDDQRQEKRLYPWGDKIDCSYANYYGNGDKLCMGDTTAAGSYLKGASFYGILDMAGNVWEWVADRYDPKYYDDPDYSNPTGPLSGDYIVIRGGSFLTGRAIGIQSSDREFFSPDSTSQAIGFRCAMDATP